MYFYWPFENLKKYFGLRVEYAFIMYRQIPVCDIRVFHSIANEEKKVFLDVTLYRHDETLEQSLMLMLRYVTFSS